MIFIANTYLRLQEEKYKKKYIFFCELFQWNKKKYLVVARNSDKSTLLDWFQQTNEKFAHENLGMLESRSLSLSQQNIFSDVIVEREFEFQWTQTQEAFSLNFHSLKLLRVDLNRFFSMWKLLFRIFFKQLRNEWMFLNLILIKNYKLKEYFEQSVLK